MKILRYSWVRIARVVEKKFFSKFFSISSLEIGHQSRYQYVK